LLNAPAAFACSYDADFDPVRDSEVIVGGRFVGWELIEDAIRWDPKRGMNPPDDPRFYGPYDPIRLSMAVDRVYKGTAPANVEMVSGNTYNGGQWIGSSGACGAFDSDPTRRYAILGLTTDKYGRYHPSLGRVFFLGDDAPRDFSAGFVSRLANLRPGSPTTEVSSSTPQSADFPTVPAAVAAVLGPLVFLAASAFLLPRRSIS
jgi:hypothetical protein